MRVLKRRVLLKPCFVEQCPHCRRIGEFWLVELSGAVGPFSGSGYSIACHACGFEKLISNPEAKRFDQLAENYRRLMAGLVSLASFERVLEEARFATILAIRKEARTWRCEACKEENPVNFTECWSCAHPHPSAPS